MIVGVALGGGFSFSSAVEVQGKGRVRCCSGLFLVLRGESQRYIQLTQRTEYEDVEVE